MARRHLENVFFGAQRSEEAYVEVRPQIEKGLLAFKKLVNFGPYMMGSELGNADIFVYHVFQLASQIIRKVYDWDIIMEIPGLADYMVVMDERASTKRVMADYETAMAELMAQLRADH